MGSKQGLCLGGHRGNLGVKDQDAPPGLVQTQRQFPGPFLELDINDDSTNTSSYIY